MNIVIITLVLLLILFATIYGDAFRKALAELSRSGPGREMVTEVSAPVSSQEPEAREAQSVRAKDTDDDKASTGAMIPATAVGSQAKLDSKQFFAQFRMERDRVRSQQVDLLREMVNTTTTAAESRAEAQKRLLELTQQMESEMKLENLMVAQGYTEAAAFIQSEGVTVVLFSSPLSLQQKKAISGLASRLIGCTDEQVSIICRN